MEPFANAFPNDQSWPITFVGGTADLSETPLASPAKTAAQPGVCLPLAMTTIGDRVWVVEIRGGRRMVRRLTDLGIVPGMEITVVNRSASGSVIIGLQGCRIGIGAGIAASIAAFSSARHRSATIHLPFWVLDVVCPQRINTFSARSASLTCSTVTRPSP